MIMENKYFVPEISDLRVGYECEIYEQSTNKLIKKIEWHPVKVIIGNSEYGKSVAINRIPKYLKQDKIRVPYLTKETIESEGWRIHDLQKEIKDKNCFLFYKKVNEETFIMVFDQSDSCKRIGIHQEVLKIPVKHFSGTCKDINTLRQIQKLLGI